MININVTLILLLSLFILVTTSVAYILMRLWSYSERKYIQNNSSYLSFEKNRTAVIFIKKKAGDEIRLFMQGTSFLLKYFMVVHQPYQVYLWPSVNLFKQIVKNKKISELYIFGHGRINGIYFSQQFIDYSLFQEYPSKMFVGQYHCNHGQGKSLADYLRATNRDVSNFYRFNVCNLLRFLLLYIRSKFFH